MDAKRLQEIRQTVYRQMELESDDIEVFNLPEYDHLDRQLAAEAPALLDYIDALKAENVRMRHDLDTTDGLYASDKEDMSRSFRIEHASLRYKPGAQS